MIGNFPQYSLRDWLLTLAEVPHVTDKDFRSLGRTRGIGFEPMKTGFGDQRIRPLCQPRICWAPPSWGLSPCQSGFLADRSQASVVSFLSSTDPDVLLLVIGKDSPNLLLGSYLRKQWVRVESNHHSDRANGFTDRHNVPIVVTHPRFRLTGNCTRRIRTFIGFRSSRKLFCQVKLKCDSELARNRVF